MAAQPSAAPQYKQVITPFIVLVFLCAFSTSAIAAWFSIIGLMAVFSGAAISIAVMGSILEIQKLVLASWLYKNWSEAPVLMKTYLTIALIILMAITSMGIFGYLSKAHIEHGMESYGSQSEIRVLRQKISSNEFRIETSKRELQQLDAQIDKFVELGAVTKSLGARKDQEEERKRINDTIMALVEDNTTMESEIIGKQEIIGRVEAKVGPLKYIAAVIYGDSDDAEILEKAVRLIIICIVIVFDPLAVIMVIAGNWSLTRSRVEIPAIQVPTNSIAAEKSIPEPIKELIKERGPSESSIRIADSINAVDHTSTNFASKYNVWRSRPK